MNINYTCFFDYIEPFKESILSSLTSQQAQIVLIASTTFIVLTAANVCRRKLQSTKTIVQKGRRVNGKLEGPGMQIHWNGVTVQDFHYPESTIFKGQFKDGMLHGQGKISYPGGRIAEGQFEKGLLHGLGKKIYNGTIFEGQFSKGELHGPGKKSDLYGIVEEGIFVKGKLINFEKILL